MTHRFTCLLLGRIPQREQPDQGRLMMHITTAIRRAMLPRIQLQRAGREHTCL